MGLDVLAEGHRVRLALSILLAIEGNRAALEQAGLEARELCVLVPLGRTSRCGLVFELIVGEPALLDGPGCGAPD